MHSAILGWIISWTSDVLVNMALPWDSGYFTLWDVIVFQILLFVIIFAIRELFMFYARKYNF